LDIFSGGIEEMNTRSSNVKQLIAALVVMVVILGCGIGYGPSIDLSDDPPKQEPVTSMQPELTPKLGDDQVVDPPGQANPTTKPDPEPEAPISTAIQLVQFKESDCAVPDLPRVDASYGPGVLRCQYRWSGKYIDDNHAVIEIDELPDSNELSQRFEEGVRDTHNSADDQADDEMLSIIRNDENGFTFILTSTGGTSSKTHTEIPQCGWGSGYMKIHDRFLVQVRLFSCDISESAVEYVRTLETMEAVADAAITRALSVKSPE
jgi:hypothetical protein